MADSGFSTSPTSPPSSSCPASPARLHTSTHQQVQDTLTQLENLWDDLGLSEDQRGDRKRIFYGHIVNLLEKILVDERALKSRIINQIEHNTIKILKLCEELSSEPEEAVDGLTLLDLDAVLQERLEKLRQTKAERQEALRSLQEKDEGLCELLCEEPFFVPCGLVPSKDQLKAVEEHIKAMEKEKDEREATYRRFKAGLLSFLEQLEQSPEDSFTQEVICSDDEDIPLDQDTIQRLRTAHSNLEFQVQENKAKSLDLRESITCLWQLLEVSQGDQQAFLATAPGHTPSSLTKLEEELEKLKVLRLHNLTLFVEKMHKELTVWWDKCYVGSEEKERINAMTADDMGEDVLMLLEGEVKRWKHYHAENVELLSTVDNFLSLFRHMLELEDRAKDPSRLFNTRGGALLQEEKAKKKVKNELPRVQKRLETMAAAWEKHNNCPFLVHGQEVMAYLDHLWETHEKRWEVEKAKRVQAKDGHVKPARAVPQARTPVAPSSTRKRGIEGEEPGSTKRPKHLLPPRNVSPSKRSPLKTPRGKPLSELNRVPPTYVGAMEQDASLQSITYDKFKDPLQSNEGLNSTTLDQAPRGIMKSLF